MTRTVQVVLELVYTVGEEHNPVRLAELDLQDMPWSKMCADKVKVRSIKLRTTREGS